VTTGEDHEDPDQDELAGDEQSSGPDVGVRGAVLVRSCVIRGWFHLIGSSLQG